MKQFGLGLLAALIWMVNGALLSGCTRLLTGDAKEWSIDYKCKGDGSLSVQAEHAIKSDHVEVTGK